MKRPTNKLKRPLIVWIYGDQDTGKTTLVKALIKRLNPLCSKFVEHRYGFSDSSDEEAYCKIGAYRIALATDGDDPKVVASHINKFSLLPVDIVVLTARLHYPLWKNKMVKHLCKRGAKWLGACDAIEIPRLVSGFRTVGSERHTMMIGLSIGELFLFLVRIMKKGIPRKWPSGGSGACLSAFDWHV